MIRAGDWTVAPIPDYLADRRVEITGPTDRKMTINALNSGRQDLAGRSGGRQHPGLAAMSSTGRSTCATRSAGPSNSTRAGSPTGCNDGDLAVIVTRPRGWHLPEKHLTIDGEPLVGALVDFGLYFFHNAAELLARGAGPAFYLPKMESHLEAGSGPRCSRSPRRRSESSRERSGRPC